MTKTRDPALFYPIGLQRMALVSAVAESAYLADPNWPQLTLTFHTSFQAFTVRLTTKEEVAGLPESALGLGAQTAKTKGDADATADAGPWVFTLDAPSFLPVMKHAKDRKVVV